MSEYSFTKYNWSPPSGIARTGLVVQNPVFPKAVSQWPAFKTPMFVGLIFKQDLFNRCLAGRLKSVNGCGETGRDSLSNQLNAPTLANPSGKTSPEKPLARLNTPARFLVNQLRKMNTKVSEYSFIWPPYRKAEEGQNRQKKHIKTIEYVHICFNVTHQICLSFTQKQRNIKNKNEYSFTVFKPYKACGRSFLAKNHTTTDGQIFFGLVRAGVLRKWAAQTFKTLKKQNEYSFIAMFRQYILGGFAKCLGVFCAKLISRMVFVTKRGLYSGPRVYDMTCPHRLAALATSPVKNRGRKVRLAFIPPFMAEVPERSAGDGGRCGEVPKLRFQTRPPLSVLPACAGDAGKAEFGVFSGARRDYSKNAFACVWNASKRTKAKCAPCGRVRVYIMTCPHRLAALATSPVKNRGRKVSLTFLPPFMGEVPERSEGDGGQRSVCYAKTYIVQAVGIVQFSAV